MAQIIENEISTFSAWAIQLSQTELGPATARQDLSEEATKQQIRGPEDHCKSLEGTREDFWD